MALKKSMSLSSGYEAEYHKIDKIVNPPIGVQSLIKTKIYVSVWKDQALRVAVKAGGNGKKIEQVIYDSDLHLASMAEGYSYLKTLDVFVYAEDC